MGRPDDTISPGDLIRRMNWQALAACLVVGGTFVGVVKWAVLIDTRITETHAALTTVSESLHGDVASLRRDSEEHFREVTATLADSATQRDKSTDRMEARITALDGSVRQLLLQIIPGRRAALSISDGRDPEH